jgi:altronate hydrolase
MFGAETLLMNRAKSKEVFEKIVEMINNFKQYFISNNMPIYENPSPGNKAGGISTLEEKSLGCVQKGGTTRVNDVLKYAERIKETGLTLLESPGNDPVAATALAASGCQIVLFSTGRGTPFSTAVPTVKISSNTALFEKKENWIDFNAGTILTGTSLETLSQSFFDYILSVANGKKTKAEENGYKEISIFKTGVTL